MTASARAVGSGAGCSGERLRFAMYVTAAGPAVFTRSLQRREEDWPQAQEIGIRPTPLDPHGVVSDSSGQV